MKPDEIRKYKEEAKAAFAEAQKENDTDIPIQIRWCCVEMLREGPANYFARMWPEGEGLFCRSCGQELVRLPAMKPDRLLPQLVP